MSLSCFSFLAVSVVTVMVSPAVSSVSSSMFMPVRISGPLVSRAIAQRRPSIGYLTRHSRMLVITPPWYSYEPWEKFMRQICMPACRSMCSSSTPWTLGPIVQMIEQLRSAAHCE